MRSTVLVVALAIAAVPVGAGGQYVGAAQEAPPSPPPGPPVPEGVPGNAAAPGTAAAPEWSVHRLRVWGTLGATFAYGQSAVSLGAGVGYLVHGGLLPSLDVGLAFGDAPNVFMLKPGLDWFLPIPGGVVPFVGGYYAHWFASGGYLPQDAWGARAGFSFASVGPATLLLGMAYERVFTNCSGACAYWVPQVAAGFAL
jgi:hypothetical protein